MTMEFRGDGGTLATDGSDSVEFALMSEDKVCNFRISREALEDLSADSLPQPDRWLEAFRQHAPRIMAVAGSRFEAGAKVLLVTEDFS